MTIRSSASFISVVALSTGCSCSEQGFRAITNEAPQLEAPVIEPADLYTDSMAACVYGQPDDPEGEPLQVEVRWYVDEQEVPGQRGDLDGLAFFDRGHTLRCEVTATDPEGQFTTMSSESVPVLNSPPVALDDSWDVQGACPLPANPDRNVLANDYDADGDPLTILVQTEPSGGSLEVQADGSFRYEPTSWGQSDSFSYVLDDGFELGSVATVTLPNGVTANPILVTTTADSLAGDGQCSLREAISAANDDAAVDACPAGAGADIIAFAPAAGRFRIELAGSLEDDNLTGDLDIWDDVTLLGCGGEVTVIDAAQQDRALDIHAGTVELLDIGVSNGLVTGDDGAIIEPGSHGGLGGGIYNRATLSIAGIRMSNNLAFGGSGGHGAMPGAGGGGGGGAALGGGLYSEGPLTISPGSHGCSFVGNGAVGGTGGNGMPHGGSTGRGGGGAGPSGGPGGNVANGLAAGWGGGGGGGGGSDDGTAGGSGGFGGGGGGGGARIWGNNSGPGGLSEFGGGQGGEGCCSAAGGGGGGAGLGGALFTSAPDTHVEGCHFEGNAAQGGLPGRNHFGGPAPEAGGGFGGATFSLGSDLPGSGNSYLGNQADTDGVDSYSFP